MFFFPSFTDVTLMSRTIPADKAERGRCIWLRMGNSYLAISSHPIPLRWTGWIAPSHEEWHGWMPGQDSGFRWANEPETKSGGHQLLPSATLLILSLPSIVSARNRPSKHLERTRHQRLSWTLIGPAKETGQTKGNLYRSAEKKKRMKRIDFNKVLCLRTKKKADFFSPAFLYLLERSNELVDRSDDEINQFIERFLMWRHLVAVGRRVRAQTSARVVRQIDNQSE